MVGDMGCKEYEDGCVRTARETSGPGGGCRTELNTAS